MEMADSIVVIKADGIAIKKKESKQPNEIQQGPASFFQPKSGWIPTTGTLRMPLLWMEYQVNNIKKFLELTKAIITSLKNLNKMSIGYRLEAINEQLKLNFATIQIQNYWKISSQNIEISPFFDHSDFIRKNILNNQFQFYIITTSFSKIHRA
jgi:hypothetical protein